uniref:Uncharacterized protein n=1 Tax=Monodelphis domestica TaxID=13616 RepID=A0A5F8G209_MONDO
YNHRSRFDHGAKVELHEHLEGAIKLATILHHSKKRGFPFSTNAVEEPPDVLGMDKPMSFPGFLGLSNTGLSDGLHSVPLSVHLAFS